MAIKIDIRRFQAGGGRILPKLVYGQSPIANLLGQPVPSGFKENMAVENLKIQQDQNIRAENQFIANLDQQAIQNQMFEKEYTLRKTRADIENLSANTKLSKDYMDNILKISVVPGDQTKLTELQKKYSIIDDTGTFTNVDISDANAMSKQQNGYVNLMLDPEMKAIMKKSTDHDRLKAQLDIQSEKDRKLAADPKASVIYDMKGNAEKLKNAYNDLNNFALGNLDAKDATTIESEFRGFTFDFSEYGKKTMDYDMATNEQKLEMGAQNLELGTLKIESTKEQIEMQKLENEKFKADMAVIDAEGLSPELAAKKKYELLKLKYGSKTGAEFNKDQYEAGVFMSLLQKQNEYNSANNIVEDPIITLNKVSAAIKGTLNLSKTDGSGDTNKTSTGATNDIYSNIYIKKDGTIDINESFSANGTRLVSIKDQFKATTDKKVTIPEGRYDLWGAGHYFSPSKGVESTFEIVNPTNVNAPGDGSVITNNPEAVGQLFGVTGKAVLDDKTGEYEKYWNAGTETFNIPLSAFSVTKGIIPVSQAYGLTPQDLGVGSKTISANTDLFIGGPVVRNFYDTSSAEEQYKDLESTGALKIHKGGASSDAEAFSKMKVPTKAMAKTLGNVIFNLPNGMGKTTVFTSFTRGADHEIEAAKAKPGGHAQGESFDLQIPRGGSYTEAQVQQQELDMIAQIAARYENSGAVVVRNGAGEVQISTGQYSFKIDHHKSHKSNTKHLHVDVFKNKSVKPEDSPTGGAKLK